MKPGSRSGSGASPESGEALSPEKRRVLSGDRTLGRAVTYWFVFLLLFVLSAVPFGESWTSGPGAHVVLETLATALAFVVGSLALVRFYSKRTGTFLFLGTGFLGTGLLDLFHGAISSSHWAHFTLLESQARSSWSFTASGAFLSLFLFVSWLAWKRERDGGEEAAVREVPVYLTAALLAVLIFLAFLLVPATQAVYPEKLISQPGELFSALFFTLALAGYLAKGHWRYDTFEHWLILALLISAMAHGAFMAFCGQSYDGDFDLAHLLKVLSYTSVLVGLLANVFTTFRREEEVGQAASEANSALAREIDIRRKAERVLQDSEEQLQDFLDNAHDLIQSVDPQGGFLYVNRAWKRALGYSDEELDELNFFEILDESCRARCTRQFRSVLSGSSLPLVEVSFRARDGRIVSCSGSANARFHDGKAVAARAIFRDITESLETRRELEAFQANLQALVENTGDAIWSVNRSLELITYNTAFSMALEARTGKEPVDSGLPEQVFPPADAAWYRDMYLRALRGEAFSELRDEEIGGQLRSYELFFNPIREAMGITGVAVFGKDVTARRRTQMALRMAKEEAERANQAKSQFLANMSHELRTPLNSVIGFTNILLKNRTGNLEAKELGFLERISANGRHLLVLINEVLDLAKIEAGRMELELQAVDLEGLIRETLAQMEGQVREKPLVLRASVPPDLPRLETDPGKLRQVIINLVGNALKFTAEGEVSVEVVTRSDGKTVSAIRVRDTGAGIPPDRLHAIFEAFQQADGTTTRQFGGTGLGLSISRSLCQLMGYDLRVESTVGEGSVFSILMADLPPPARAPEEALMEEALRPMESSRPGLGREPEGAGGDAASAEAGRPAGEEGEASPGRVLVIDDDPDSRALLTDFLEDTGVQVVTAPSAMDGLRKARTWGPDLITLDLMMPEVSGWEALKALKEDPDLREIPVVIVSILAGEGNRSNLVGAVDILAKPVDRSDLLRVVERNLSPGRTRVALVVDDDPDTREMIRTHLEEAGLKVVLAANGREAEGRLEEEIPDVILLDLLMPEMDGLTFLSRLRSRRREKGLPVVVCTAKELDKEEKARLQAKASGVITKGKGLEEELKEILSCFFPLRDPDGPA